MKIHFLKRYTALLRSLRYLISLHVCPMNIVGRWWKNKWWRPISFLCFSILQNTHSLCGNLVYGVLKWRIRAKAKASITIKSSFSPRITFQYLREVIIHHTSPKTKSHPTFDYLPDLLLIPKQTGVRHHPEASSENNPCILIPPSNEQ